MIKGMAVVKNLDLLDTFMKYAFDHPDILNTIPADAELVILPKEDIELYRENKKLAESIANEGKKVVAIHLQKPRISRPWMSFTVPDTNASASSSKDSYQEMVLHYDSKVIERLKPVDEGEKITEAEGNGKGTNSEHGKDHARDENILALTNVAKTLISCSKDINKVTETIMRSLDSPGTNGEAHKDMLQTKVKNFKKLSSLQISAADKMLSAAKRLENGIPTDEVMSNILDYGQFLNDQLKCEEYDAQRIISRLRENY